MSCPPFDARGPAGNWSSAHAGISFEMEAADAGVLYQTLSLSLSLLRARGELAANSGARRSTMARASRGWRARSSSPRRPASPPPANATALSFNNASPVSDSTLPTRRCPRRSPPRRPATPRSSTCRRGAIRVPRPARFHRFYAGRCCTERAGNARYRRVAIDCGRMCTLPSRGPSAGAQIWQTAPALRRPSSGHPPRVFVCVRATGRVRCCRARRRPEVGGPGARVATSGRAAASVARVAAATTPGRYAIWCHNWPRGARVATSGRAGFFRWRMSIAMASVTSRTPATFRHRGYVAVQK